MQFYCNDVLYTTKDRQNTSNLRRMLNINLTDEEAAHLGVTGTRLALRHPPESDKVWVLAPHHASRTRLHKRARPNNDGHPWEICFFQGVANWPISGKTVLPCFKHEAEAETSEGYQARNYFILKPYDAALVPVRKQKQHAYKEPRTRHQQPLPLDLPPCPDKVTVIRSLTGTVAPPQIDTECHTNAEDLRAALALLNETLALYPDPVHLIVEKYGAEACYRWKVRARIEVEL